MLTMPRKQHEATPGSFAERLQKLRAKQKLTQAEAAKLADVPVRTWRSWENEQNTPSRFVIAAITGLFSARK